MKTNKRFGISVVVRTRDSENIHGLLKALSLQTIRPAQLVVVDNYSHKENLERTENLLREKGKKLFHNDFPIELIPLADTDFSHPYSTNVGVFYAENEYACITNGHSLPVSRTWLENGLSHFKDPSVVGVSGYFHPSSNASVWEKLHGFAWATSREATNISRKDLYFSTMNCLLRKSCWMKYPFDENLPAIISESRKYGGEDYDWGLEMIARGYRIVIEPKFDVYHSHNEKFSPFLSRRIALLKLKGNIRAFKRPRESFSRVFDSENRVFEL